MSAIDWIILLGTLLSIVSYGIWKSKNTKTMESYLLADRQLPWYHVGFSVMATQASAITFLSAPGLAYSDGMQFVQFYFGLPLAMIVLCITFIPIFHRLNVYTAYEYLEKRFDNKTRSLTAFLFLIQRGISTGITIYAPAIVLSTLLQIDITFTTILMAGLVILYTVYGGTKAVSYTQVFQMIIIFSGLFLAAYMVIHLLPANVGVGDALHVAGKMGKLHVIDTKFDKDNNYNIWSGIIGGFFLQLSYFGTDQSQVGRYLTGKSIAQSRLGLVMNGLLKIPMQFLILGIGTLVFTYYQYHKPPLFFNQVEVAAVKESKYKKEYEALENQFTQLHKIKKEHVQALVNAEKNNNTAQVQFEKENLKKLVVQQDSLRSKATQVLKKHHPRADVNDTNFVFLRFVMDVLPTGLVGLLIAIIFLASMGSTASGLNSLASTTMIDGYKRFIRPNETPENDLKASRWITVFWGAFCLVVALFAAQLGNLIEVVNKLGSLFYGTILGIFVVAFYVKFVQGKAVFIAALLTESLVILAWYFDLYAYLWLNVVGCVLMVIISSLLQIFIGKNKAEHAVESSI